MVIWKQWPFWNLHNRWMNIVEMANIIKKPFYFYQLQIKTINIKIAYCIIEILIVSVNFIFVVISKKGTKIWLKSKKRNNIKVDVYMKLCWSSESSSGSEEETDDEPYRRSLISALFVVIDELLWLLLVDVETLVSPLGKLVRSVRLELSVWRLFCIRLLIIFRFTSPLPFSPTCSLFSNTFWLLMLELLLLLFRAMLFRFWLIGFWFDMSRFFLV